jgi:DNA-binding NarL/FixJ family response regulator
VVTDTDVAVLLRAERVTGPETSAPIVVAVQASDELMGAGAMAYLASRTGITAVPASRIAEADVVLVLADRCTDDLMAWIQRVAAQDRGGARFVLVSDWIPVPQLMRSLGGALLAVLPRQGSDYEQVVRAIFQLRGQQRPVARLAPPAARLAPSTSKVLAAALVHGRELDILRLLADGLDTVEIAHRLHYSERTIKNIIHTMLGRLELRNRPHAVAFAIRHGLL